MGTGMGTSIGIGVDVIARSSDTGRQGQRRVFKVE